MSFVRLRELVSFDPRHVTRSLKSENVLELGGITNSFNFKIVITHLIINWRMRSKVN